MHPRLPDAAYPTGPRLMKRLFSLLGSVLALALAVIGLTPSTGFASTGGTNADPTLHTSVVSAVPSALTPNIDDGTVLAFAQVGNTMVVGGTSPVSPTAPATSPEATCSRSTPTTGDDQHHLRPDAQRRRQLARPRSRRQHGLSWAATSHVVNGSDVQGPDAAQPSTPAQRVAGFTPADPNGVVSDIERAGNRLFIGGTFTNARRHRPRRLATLNATTGARDNFSTQHRRPATTTRRPAHGAKGPSASPTSRSARTANRMVAIGNFKTSTGCPATRSPMFDLSGATGRRHANWSTQRYAAGLLLRRLRLLLSATSTARRTAATSSSSPPAARPAARCATPPRASSPAPPATDVQPTWVDVRRRRHAVLGRGHRHRRLRRRSPALAEQRQRRRLAGTGAVPRPGLGGARPADRRPADRGTRAATRAAPAPTHMFADAGRPLGRHGHRLHRQPQVQADEDGVLPAGRRLHRVASTRPALPGNVYLGGRLPGARRNILYRVDAGGPPVAAARQRPGLEQTTRPTTSPSATPAATPRASERHVPGDSTVPSHHAQRHLRLRALGPGDGNLQLSWHFPVPTGDPRRPAVLRQRLHGTAGSGQRVFNVTSTAPGVLTQLRHRGRRRRPDRHDAHVRHHQRPGQSTSTSPTRWRTRSSTASRSSSRGHRPRHRHRVLDEPHLRRHHGRRAPPPRPRRPRPSTPGPPR